MGGETKQTRDLGGAPVLVQSLRAFDGLVDAAVVVVQAGEEQAISDVLSAHGVTAAVTAGGATRQASVANGVRALPRGVEVVLVHDAVRPFVTRAVIASTIQGVRAYGAAAAAVAVADTLRRSKDLDAFGATVSRDGLWAMQTPQGARRDWLVAASDAATEAATDEVGLLQAAGFPVHVVEGDARNIKLTRPSDWDLALALWAMRDEG